MVDRRNLLISSLAVTLAANAPQGPPVISETAAKREFLKILSFFNTADVAGFLAYGPLRLFDGKKPVAPDAMPAFFRSISSANGKPDKKPAWLEPGSFSRMSPPNPPWVFVATVSRSVWNEEFLDEMSHPPMLFEAGYRSEFSLWLAWFEGERISRLERRMEIA